MRTRIAALVGAAVLTLGLLAGCGGGDDEAVTTNATPVVTAMPTVTTQLTTPTAIPDTPETARARAEATRKATASKARARHAARVARARAARAKQARAQAAARARAATQARARAARAKARARAAREGARASALKFQRNWVRFKVITKEHLGGQMQAFVVGRGGDMDNMRQAGDCVQHFTRTGGQKANFCWVFPSQKALDFAKVDRNDGSMRKLCWMGRAGVPLSGSADADVDVNDSGLFEADGCPR